MMREAADLESVTEKEAVTPGEVLPAGELLGDMLTEMERFEEAMSAYQEVLETHSELTDKMPYPAYFAMSKIIKCYREILDEIKPGVELMLGSWELTYHS